VEPTLMVIGLNFALSYSTAPAAMRDRFRIGESRYCEVLQQLKNAEGIDEVVVVSTGCRTEFLLWAAEPTLAANSVVHFLAAELSLRLSDWEHFYRLLDEAAIAHIFRVVAGLDALPLRETETENETRIVSQVQAAREAACAAGAAGRFLNALLDQALSVSEHVHAEAASAAEKIVAAEAQAFCGKLRAESAVPTVLSTTVVALRHRLEELCRQELESFIEERGPFTREQDESLHAITSQIVQKITGSLARELKELPEQEEREKMTAAVTRLFHLNSVQLDSPNSALAGTKLKRETSRENLGRGNHDRREEQVAIH